VIFSCEHTVDVMGLSLKLLGQFEIRDSSGTALSLPTRKTRALLGYLAINAERPQPRERLMALLWSDRGEKQARQSLNHALRAIRKLGEKEDVVLIESDGESVTLRGDALESDAGRLRDLLNDQPGEAAALYTGPFLDGLSVPDPIFEEWLLATRSEFHALVCEALEAAAGSNDTTTAIDCLRRLLALDPLREEAHRQLMRLLHQSGDRAGALRQYQACAEILNRELQVDPDATTRALFEKIRRDSRAAAPEVPETAIESTPEEHPSHTQPNSQRLQPSRWHIAVAAMVLLAIGSGMTMWLASRTTPTDTAYRKSASLPLSGKPSIAVLPFSNLSGEKEQEYFSDGITEDLITDLSKISTLTVISRSSTTGYKGREIDIREVGNVLNVRYVIQGSVRKAGERIRINAQLIDAATGGHLWAERYDGDLNDIFGLQDRVLEQIVASLALRLSENERERLADKGTDSVAAHDLYLRGLFQESTFTREGFQEAKRLYEQALSIDPGYALPYARIANILELSTRNGWSDDIQGDLKKAVELTEKAVALDPQNSNLHWSLGRATARLRTPAALVRGIESLHRAIELDADFADAYAFLTVLYIADGRAEDGLRSVETAMRLNPRYPFWYIFMRGMTRYVVEDYDAAIADFEAAAERSPTATFLRFWLAASYAQVGRTDDAEWQVEELEMMGVETTIATIIDSGPIQDPGYLSLFKAGLRKAGMPD
jgi:TolB-like protein/DNA-binding SARP family transcriptional activator